MVELDRGTVSGSEISEEGAAYLKRGSEIPEEYSLHSLLQIRQCRMQSRRQKVPHMDIPKVPSGRTLSLKLNRC
jgi:hypothetical protein